MTKSRLLVDEPPLVVAPSLATKLGLEAAIFMQQLHYWIGKSKHEHEGERWVYNTAEEWLTQFPFMSDKSFRRMVARLRADGLIRTTDRWNKNRWNRMLWYTIDYAKLAEIVESPVGPIENVELVTLPSSITETTVTETTQISREEDARNIFTAIQDRIVAEGTDEVEFEIRNIDQYVAKFKGTLPPVDLDDLSWFVVYLDRIRRKYLGPSAIVAPLRIPAPGLLKAIFPRVREWHDQVVAKPQASQRLWHEVLITFSADAEDELFTHAMTGTYAGATPRDWSMVLYKICTDLPGVYEAFAREAAIIYTKVT